MGSSDPQSWLIIRITQELSKNLYSPGLHPSSYSFNIFYFILFLKCIYLLIFIYYLFYLFWLRWVLVAACGI